MGRIANLRQSLSIANQKLQSLADHDGLTGLLNRRSMDAQVDQIWFESEPLGLPFALLMIDIDNFKRYNDHYGHQMGDDCLRNVAKAIEEAIVRANQQGTTSGALVARYGGEEFAVIVPGALPQAVEALSASILASVRQRAIAHERNDAWGIVTVSIGGARMEKVSGELAKVFRSADQRLYAAKSQGRNCAVLQ
jgi:diguanylate cyclase (GGDEF)-like protein